MHRNDWLSVGYSSRIFTGAQGPEYSYSVDTTSYYVEILNFRYFYRHCVFVEKDGFERQKVIKDYINVSVVINLV